MLPRKAQKVSDYLNKKRYLLHVPIIILAIPYRENFLTCKLLGFCYTLADYYRVQYSSIL